MSAPRLVAGVFVGGESRRMGGRPKGLLLAPALDGRGGRVSLVERAVALAREQCDEVVLVGRADAYAALGQRAIDDASAAGGGVVGGPLAGLVALLEHAERMGGRAVLALACDMPYLTRDMLARLARFAPDAAAVAPREKGDRPAWSPLFARYDSSRVVAIARARLEGEERSLRSVLDAVDTRELPLSADERSALRDWDAPEDIDVREEAP